MEGVEGEKDGGGSCSSSSAHVSAELANATGNRLYREGNFEQAGEAYSRALEDSSRAKEERGCADDWKCRSKYYANRLGGLEWLLRVRLRVLGLHGLALVSVVAAFLRV